MLTVIESKMCIHLFQICESTLFFFLTILHVLTATCQTICLYPCLDCSCEADCGLYNTCCFKEMDKFNIDMDKSMSCVKATTSQHMIPSVDHAYYMVDTCPMVSLIDLLLYSNLFKP